VLLQVWQTVVIVFSGSESIVSGPVPSCTRIGPNFRRRCIHAAQRCSSLPDSLLQKMHGGNIRRKYNNLEVTNFSGVGSCCPRVGVMTQNRQCTHLSFVRAQHYRVAIESRAGSKIPPPPAPGLMLG